MDKRTCRFRLSLIIATFVGLVMLTSCSGDDYINAIPANSTALLSFDASALGGKPKAENIKRLLGVKDVEDCGIDFSNKVYVFETVDGNIGLVAKVDDDDNLNDWLNGLSSKGLCTKTEEKGDNRFAVLKNSWVVGFSSDALLIMGPVLPAQQAEAKQQILRYFNQDEDNGIKTSPLFERLDSIDSAVALVARADALPEQFAMPFTLGAPKGTDASQIIISAEIARGSANCLEISGETFSLDKEINAALKSSMATLRPIQGKYVRSMSSSDTFGAFLNVDGKQFINMLHSEKSFQALLAGLNTAIDMDNIIKSIDGDLAIVANSYGADQSMALQMGAQLASKDFLADVGYWKQSCPAGCKIVDWGKNSYLYTDGKLNYYFGVTDDMQYFSGSTPEKAQASISSAKHSLPVSLTSKIAGKRMCMVLNVRALAGGAGQYASVMSFIEPFFGKVETVLYYLK